jgi:hypothetical protein
LGERPAAQHRREEPQRGDGEHCPAADGGLAARRSGTRGDVVCSRHGGGHADGDLDDPRHEGDCGHDGCGVCEGGPASCSQPSGQKHDADGAGCRPEGGDGVEGPEQSVVLGDRQGLVRVGSLTAQRSRTPQPRSC